MTRLLKTTRNLLLCCCTVMLVAACGDDSPTKPTPDGGPPPDGPGVTDGPGPNTELQWGRETLDYENAGRWTSISSSGNKVGLISFVTHAEPVETTCTLNNQLQKRTAHDLKYFEFDGAGWNGPFTITTTYHVTYGTSLVFDQSGNPQAGYLGGELSLRECASSDAVIATSVDGGENWSENIINVAGDTGDTVGHWTSVAINPTDGSVHAAYRDVHFGFYEQDGNARADLLYDGGENLGPDIGDGDHANLLFTPDGTPVVVAANLTKTGADGGIQLYIKGGAEWTKKQIAAVGTSPTFATDGNGNYMIAYYHPSKKVLMVTESSDLEIWSAAASVDKSLTYHGTFPRAAYDHAGNPGISYYRCSDAGENDCVASQDGLMFAWKRNGKWQTWDVDSGGNNTCGQYTALTFNQNNEPYIGYQCVTFDNLTNDFIATLKVAKGTWKTQ